MEHQELKNAAQINLLKGRQHDLNEMLYELVADMQARFKTLDAKIDGATNEVITASREMRRGQLLNVDAAAANFRANAIKFCLGKE